MIRIEITANHSVEENILEAFKERDVAKFYTKYPTVYGVGSTGPRMGDSIWPETNFALVIWCEANEAKLIEEAVAAVKEQFPDEGIKLFKLFDSSAYQLSPHLALPKPEKSQENKEIQEEIIEEDFSYLFRQRNRFGPEEENT
ncbi:MAG: hypothetical protein LBQ77_02880 [Treponema sp.]|nr:hypothetical protein [Treponema sp.]